MVRKETDVIDFEQKLDKIIWFTNIRNVGKKQDDSSHGKS
jgi:hypothetical protein